MTKRYTPGAELPETEEAILRKFLSDHDLALRLIHPSERHQWQHQEQTDAKASESRFVQFASTDQLRRVLASRSYGTKAYLPEKAWERPFLQSFLDQAGVLDGCDQDVDLAQQSERRKVYERIQAAGGRVRPMPQA